jgi:hypothetical protein
MQQSDAITGPWLDVVQSCQRNVSAISPHEMQLLIACAPCLNDFHLYNGNAERVLSMSTTRLAGENWAGLDRMAQQRLVDISLAFLKTHTNVDLININLLATKIGSVTEWIALVDRLKADSATSAVFQLTVCGVPLTDLAGQTIEIPRGKQRRLLSEDEIELVAAELRLRNCMASADNLVVYTDKGHSDAMGRLRAAADAAGVSLTVRSHITSSAVYYVSSMATNGAQLATSAAASVTSMFGRLASISEKFGSRTET